MERINSTLDVLNNQRSSVCYYLVKNKITIATILLISLLYLFSLNPTRYVDPDTGHYLVIAKSFADGNGYRLISSPSNPSENLVFPIYPLLLVPVFLFANGSFLAARAISAIFAMLSLGVIYLIAREFFRPRMATAVMALVGLSPMVMIYARNILTEIPYMFFSLVAVFLIYKYDKKGVMGHSYLYLAFIFVLLALFTKLSGLILVITIVIYSS